MYLPPSLPFICVYFPNSHFDLFILFNNQFTPDEVYDNYPADRLMHDIALALMAVQTQTTEVLDSFPTIPVTQEADQILKEIEQEP